MASTEVSPTKVDGSAPKLNAMERALAKKGKLPEKVP